jgi:predicted PurR-regulated permease PerM
MYFSFTVIDLINYIDKDNLIKIISMARDWFILLSDNLFFVDIKQFDVSSIDVQQIVSHMIDLTAKIGRLGISFIKDILLILLFYFFVLLYGEGIFIFIQELLPLSKMDVLRLFSQMSNTMGIVFYSILATAIFEGLLFGMFVGFYIDYDILLFSIIYGFSSLIPVIGGLLIWLPICLYELSSGNVTEAIVVAIYSIIVISIIADTFIKPLIIKYIDEHIVKSSTKVNELLIFFSMIAGLSTFGFWGLIFGPAITSTFISIANLYKSFYNKVL